MEKMKNSALSNRFPDPISIAHRPADKPHAVQCKRWKEKKKTAGNLVGRQTKQTSKNKDTADAINKRKRVSCGGKTKLCHRKPAKTTKQSSEAASPNRHHCQLRSTSPTN